MNDRTRLHEETGRAWDITAGKYEREEAADLEMLRAGKTSLLAPELPFLKDLGRWCRRAIHVQCSGGTDALSLWKLGAAEIVGIDISPRMIAVARRKSTALGAPAQWHCCDVLDTPSSLNGTADLVYTGKGAICWMMDLDAWAAVIERLLAPGGRFYMFEGHPLDWVWDTEIAGYALDKERGNYFTEELSLGQRWPAPFIKKPSQEDGKSAPDVVAHERQWTLGDIVTSLARQGLRLEVLQEHPHLFWDQFPHLPSDQARRLPHTFSLLMRKT